MEALGTRRIVRIGCIALFYALLTLSTLSFTFDNAQIRLAEMFMVLCLYSKDSVVAVTLGSFAANVFSPFGAYNVSISTLAALIAGILIYLTRKRVGVFGVIAAAFISTAVNAPAVSAVIYLNIGEDFMTNLMRIAISEFFVVLIGGAILNYYISRAKGLRQFLSDNVKASVR